VSELHPRVSVNAISSFSWTLSQDLDFWPANGIGQI